MSEELRYQSDQEVSTAGASSSDIATATRKASGLTIAVAVLLVLLGVIGLVYVWLATITSVVVFGWFLLAAGVAGLVDAFQARGRAGFWLTLITAALNVAAGVIILLNIGESILTLTLVVAMLLIAGGVFRLVAALGPLPGGRLWLILQGVINIGLGILILAEWPSSSYYVIGTIVSINLLLDGISLATVGTVGRWTSKVLARGR